MNEHVSLFFSARLETVTKFTAVEFHGQLVDQLAWILELLRLWDKLYFRRKSDISGLCEKNDLRFILEF